ncbi:MAG: hypothetical protein KJ566_03235 [Nanoarchaeota archaeon]|nr:hypothetical protein [Nanoarchaeota archaeon]
MTLKQKIKIINPDSQDYVKIRPFLMNSFDMAINFEKFSKKGSIRDLPIEEIVNMVYVKSQFRQPKLYRGDASCYELLLFNESELIQGNLVSFKLIESLPDKKEKFRELNSYDIEEAISNHVLSGKNIDKLLMKFDYVSMDEVKSLFIPITKSNDLFKLSEEYVKDYIVDNWAYFSFRFNHNRSSDANMVSENNYVKIGFEHEKTKPLYTLAPQNKELAWIDIPKKYLSLEGL